MTERDNSSGRFLERWSRKKIEGEREAAGSPAQSDAKAESRPEPTGSREPFANNDAKASAEAAPKPGFDLTSLPSLDSITAATDIRAFLVPGVPRELARAALRRAWSADPAIRDFKGLAENDWDFTDPAAMPGFGALPEGYDVRKLVAQIFGEDEKPAAPETAPAEPSAPQISTIAGETPADIAPPPDPEGTPQRSADAAGRQLARSDIVQRDNNIAPHNSIPDEPTEERKNRRTHGSALPQ
jgi:hypothetical protein